LGTLALAFHRSLGGRSKIDIASRSAAIVADRGTTALVTQSPAVSDVERGSVNGTFSVVVRRRD